MTESNRKLGLISVILLGVNMVFGSGIYLLPGQVMSLVGGSSSLLVYGFVSLLTLAIAWCFAECATLFNRNGGAYLYAKEAFGNFIGFEIGMMRWAVGSIAWASLAVGFVTILSSIWPEAILEPMRTILILSIICGLGLVNMLNLGMMSTLNNMITITKLAPLCLFAIAAIFYLTPSNLEASLSTGIETKNFGSASLMVFYAFGGFEALVVAAGEMKKPKKNLPIAVMAIIIICALVYLFIQFIAMGTLGESLASSVNPIADVAEIVLGPSGKLLITTIMLISIGGINIAAAFISPKVGVALAEDGLIPEIFAKKNRWNSPYLAILVTVAATSLMALTGDFSQLVVVSVVSRFAQYISTCLAVLVLFKHRYTLRSPLRLLSMLIPLIGLCGIGWMILQTPFFQLIYGLATLIISLPLYFLWYRRSAKEVVPT